MDARRFARPNPVIGIFPPKALSWPTLAAIIDDCRRHFGARQIVDPLAPEHARAAAPVATR